MREALQYVSWAIGLALNLLVISALLRGSYRQYRLAFAYALTLLVSTVVEIALRKAPRTVQDFYYWTDEVVLDFLVFCVVIAFIDRAAADAQRRPLERRWLVMAAALVFLVSFLLHRGLNLNLRMTLVSRDLNICAVILDLVLWSLLLLSRKVNRRLLLLSGGLGIQLTGAIMGESVRGLAPAGQLPGTLLEVITGFLGLYIWWRALRSPPALGNSPA